MPVDVARTSDPRPLALTRMGTGVAALIIAVETHAILESISAPGMLRLPVIAGVPVEALADPIFALWVACAVALAFGFAGRAAAAGVSALAALALLLDQQTYSNHLLLLAVLTALLAAGRPSAAWSIDARRGKGAPRVPYWPMFLIKVQIVTVYAFAALSKVNSSFLSGDIFETFGRGIADTMLTGGGEPFLIAASVLTVGTEAGLALALAHPRLRPAAFPLALLLHVGIVLMIVPAGPLFAFGLLCLSTYPLFLEVDSRSLVVWDDGCAFCSRSVALLKRLDWFETHEFVGSSDASALRRAAVSRAEADHALQLRTGGTRLEGYDAIGRILEVCPLTFFVAPLLRLWPLAAVGRSAYRRVALNRVCAVRPAVATNRL